MAKHIPKHHTHTHTHTHTHKRVVLYTLTLSVCRLLQRARNVRSNKEFDLLHKELSNKEFDLLHKELLKIVLKTQMHVSQ